ncbi:MAG: hypothetical protein GY805_15360, partial [Chloroflexi bacterium]|nr:hypothetical protein [Chloroflexota bacterium]
MNSEEMELIEIKGKDRQSLAGLFTGHLGGFVPDSILDGYVGKAFADREQSYFAVLELPSAKLSILGGDAAHPLAQQYLQTLPKFSWIL